MSSCVKELCLSVPHMVKSAICESILIVSKDARRKVSLIKKRQTFIDLAFLAVLDDDPQSFEKKVQELKFDRIFWEEVIDHFLKTTKNCEEMDYAFLKNGDKSYFILCDEIKADPKHLSASYKTVAFNFDKYLKFKEMVIQKYLKFAVMESNKAAKYSQSKIDSEDMFKNMVMAINKAISKYDPRKGTLTQYVKNWFMDAKTNTKYDSHIGEVFSLSASGRRSVAKKYHNNESSFVNFVVNIEDENLNIEDESITPEDRIFQKNTLKLYNTIFSEADDLEIKFAQIVLGIPFHPDKDQLKRINLTGKV